ncbi:hypothetical protein AHAT_34980 [Agarivorans sp. Toyoura001]|nr:hypothetical protein AHAT_34980 [Agarivorans sp. Toyoura001]
MVILEEVSNVNIPHGLVTAANMPCNHFAKKFGRALCHNLTKHRTFNDNEHISVATKSFLV